MADAVRTDMRRTGCFERTAPAVVILARGQVLAGLVRGRQHMRAIVMARCRRKQPIGFLAHGIGHRSEEHTSELQSLMRNSYAVFCLKTKKQLLYIPSYL